MINNITVLNTTKKAVNRLRKIFVDINKSDNNFFILLLFVITFTIYMICISPSVYGGDTGDFLAAAVTRGVPHPSGYPLYTALGELALLLPIPKSPAWKIGLISALFSSIAVVVYYLIINHISKDKIISFISSLTLAFVYTFWLYAEITEVFSLHVLLMLIITYWTLIYFEKKSRKILYIISFFAGLSLTNNLSIVLILFPIAVAILITNIKILKKPFLIIKLIIIFLIGLLPYVYIPIVANNSPVINWGNAVNLNNFLALILRKEYSWYTDINYYDIDYMFTQLKLYFSYLLSYISPIIVIFSLFGIIELSTKKRIRILFLFVSLYLLTGPLYIIYSRASFSNLGDIASVEKFFLPSIISLMLFYPFGILLLLNLISKLVIITNLKSLLKKSTVFIFALIPITLFIVNFGKTNLSNCYIGDNLGRDILESVPENSILLLSDDSMSFNTIYIQQAYGVRKDVAIPGKYNNFKVLFEEAKVPSNYIDFVMNSTPSFNALVYPLILNAMRERDVFSAEKLDIKSANEISKDVVAVPYGLIFKLEFADNNTLSEKEFLERTELLFSKYHLNELYKNPYLVDNNFFLAHIRRFYALAYLSTSKYILEKYSDEKMSVEYAKKAKDIDPLLFEQQ